MKQKLLFLNLLVSAVSTGCVTVPNITTCTVAGVLSAGGICAETLTGKTSEMTFEQFITFLEPQGPPNQKGAAICQSSEDWNKLKTAIEEACRELGPKCTYEMKTAAGVR